MTARSRPTGDVFVGAKILDCDIDAPMFTRTLANAASDYHLLYDMVTGENGLATPLMKHTGSGQGAPLRHSIVNQYINRHIAGGSTSAYIGSGIDVILWKSMVFIPSGETSDMRLVLRGEQTGFNFWIDVETAAGANVTTESFTEYGDLRICDFNFGSSGAWFMLAVKCRWDTEDVDLAVRINSIHLFPITANPQFVIWPIETNANQIDVPSVSAGTALYSQSIYDNMIDQNNRSINARTLTWQNQNLSAMTEYLTGWPAQGNRTLTNADSGATAPTSPRTAQHSRAIFGSEPLPPFNLFCEGFGSIQDNRTAGDPKFAMTVDAAVSAGAVNWYAPFVNASTITTEEEVRRLYCYVPNIPATAGAFTIKILASETAANKITNWQMRVTTGAGSSSWVSPTLPASTTNQAIFTITDCPMSPDTINSFSLTSKKTAGAAALGQFNCLGWSAAYVG